VDAILEATARVLVDEGYDKASTNRVAEVAGVSIGSLYQYFPSKAALIATLMEQHVDQMTDLMVERLAAYATAPLPVAVRKLVETMIDAHRVNPELHRVFAEQLPRTPGHDKVQQIEQRVGGLLQGYLQARKGELRVTDAKLATFVIAHTVESLTHAAVIDHPELLEDNQIVDEMTDVVLRYLVD